MWEAFLAIAYKEYLHLSRDKARLVLTVVLQVVDLFTIGYIDTTLRRAPTVIVDQDHSVDSQNLVDRLVATNTLEVKFRTSSVEQARGHIRAGRAQVAIVIPADYHRLRAANQPVKILTLVDGSDSAVSSQAIAAVDGVTARLSAEARQRAPDEDQARVATHSFFLFNPTGITSHFMLPALLAVFLMHYLGMAAESLMSEQHGGNLERLLMTPMNYTGLILGKVTPIAVIAIANGLLYLTMMRWVMGVPIRGPTIIIVCALVLYAITILSLGMLVAAGSPATAEVKIDVLWWSAVIMSGYFFPIHSFPAIVRPFAHLLPTSHMIAIMRGACIRGASLWDLAPHFAYLVMTPPLFLYLAGRRFAASVAE